MNRIDTEYRREFQNRYGIIGDSYIIQNAINILERVAPTDLPVLITGETGTGKEVFANAVHNLSFRKSKPFVSVNCGAIPETLLESELFGHEKGAFTGAVDQRIGFFEAANKGTIFLDEIGEMPVSTQVKLLRILESGEYSRLGSSAINKVDVRIIAATNRKLEDEVRDKTFRQDLFYRLNSVNIILPSLREHPEDIALYVDYFGQKLCQKQGIEYKGMADDAIRMLQKMEWKGNLRELKNLVEKVITLEKGNYVTADIMQRYMPATHNHVFDLLNHNHNNSTALIPTPQAEVLSCDALILRSLLELKQDTTDIKRALAKLGSAFQELQNDIAILKSNTDANYGNQAAYYHSSTLAEMEKQVIIDTLNTCQGNRRRTAQILGIADRTLYRKIKEYGLE